MLFDLFMLGTDVVTHYGTRAAGRLVQPRQHVHSGGLAGTIGTQETENLATPDTERNVIYGMERAKGLHQVLHFYHILLFCMLRLCHSLLNAWRIEDISELIQDGIGRTDTP